jgi:acetyl esterase/lipase
VKINYRVRLFDTLLQCGGYRISGARSEADVQRIRDQRKHKKGIAGALLRIIGGAVYGRPDDRVLIDDRNIPGSTEPLIVRRYRKPDTPGDAPLIINFHGGGWALGNLDSTDWACSTIAGETAAVVISVGYRLSPDNPAPAAIEDCIAATIWIARHAAEFGATGPLVVMGDSAGGNLAALVAIEARDRGEPQIAFQILIYPSTDLALTFPSIYALANAPMLTRNDIETFIDFYLATGIARDDPRVSPYYVDDLTGVAPALVQTAEQDPLRDEGRAYAWRLREAGVHVRWTEYPGMPHGFISLPGLCDPAREAVAEIARELHRLDRLER